MNHRHSGRRITLPLGLFVLMTTVVQADEARNDASTKVEDASPKKENLFDLSLEQLINIQISKGTKSR